MKLMIKNLNFIRFFNNFFYWYISVDFDEFKFVVYIVFFLMRYIYIDDFFLVRES